MIRWRSDATAGEVPHTGRAHRHVVISSFDNPEQAHYNGGGVAVVEMIAARLLPHFDVTVVTAAPSAGTVVRDGVRYRSMPIGRAGPRAGQLLYHAMLPLAVRRIPHDLWIENFTPPFSTSFLPIFSRSPVLGLVQTLSGGEMSSRYHLPFFAVERLGLRFYRDIVVLNPADQQLVQRYGRSAAVRLIPNGIAPTRLDEALAGSGEHILFLGRIDVWKKGLDLLLDAYGRSGLTMPLLIAGAGVPGEERKLSRLISGVDGNVRWIGHVAGQAKQDLLDRSAFVMVPSRHETFGLVALEAMSRGKPVVHFDLPTLGWMDGDVSVRPYDVGALATEMRVLAGDEAARRTLGRTAHATAQRYSSDESGDRYLEVVRELLGAPAAGVLA
ncbi:MAG TPA: glycosyltransferase family 4 protein [Streptosporangiaceae bacterium]|nr:glycosyltransferase family 4 protein [Streptosporangiaceae bacterium]